MLLSPYGARHPFSAFAANDFLPAIPGSRRRIIVYKEQRSRLRLEYEIYIYGIVRKEKRPRKRARIMLLRRSGAGESYVNVLSKARVGAKRDIPRTRNGIFEARLRLVAANTGHEQGDGKLAWKCWGQDARAREPGFVEGCWKVAGIC